MSNYNHAKDLEGQVLTLIEAIVPEVERATAAKSIFRRLFHEWVEGLDVESSKPCVCAVSHLGSCKSHLAQVQDGKFAN